MTKTPATKPGNARTRNDAWASARFVGGRNPANYDVLPDLTFQEIGALFAMAWSSDAGGDQLIKEIEG